VECHDEKVYLLSRLGLGRNTYFQIRFEKIEIFDTLQSGWFATPRFSSLSGALMCDSKKAYHPSFVLGFFLALS
jgi:hypothetical protein